VGSVLRQLSLLRLLNAAVLVGVCAAGFSGAAAAGASAQRLSGPAGIVPALGATPSAAAPRVGTSLLTYHGGPVMRTNTTYAIFWLPSGSGLSFGGDNAGYEGTVDQFFTDVGHDSGGTANVFSIDTQYYDTLSGMTHIAYNSTFGGSVVATDPLPSQQCSDGWGDADCVTDAQLQAEIASVVAAQHWPKDTSHLYFIFTPEGLGSCAGGECSYTTYCAYHDDFFPGGGASPILYANQPWTYGPSYDCDAGQYPNGSPADPTINVVSHEFNEAVTDAEPSTALAWIDSSGNEIGDKCAWNFGSRSGPSGAEYNQTIDGHHYLLQQEFDNSSDACQLHAVGAPAPTVRIFSPGSGVVGAAVTITGTGFTSATSVAFNGVPVSSFTASSTTKIKTTVPIGATTGPISVTGPGGTGTSSASFTVLAPPSLTSVAPGSGVDGAPVTINGSGFMGTKSVKFNGKTASFTLVSDGRITTSVPVGATSGTITVTTGIGTGTSSSPFLVLPALSSFSPVKARIGTTVTLSGSGFTGATSVTFHGTAATAFTVSSDKKITVAVPVGATSGTIAVTTPSGTATSGSSFTVLS
jgi:hypothetical protein